MQTQHAALATLFTLAACAHGQAATAPMATATTFEGQYREVLAAMVAVDTSHGGETKLLEPIAERYRQVGVPVQILESAPGRGNLIARLAGNGGGKKPMLLLAHVDVVPVEGQPWTVPPFVATEKDGFLWGRGVNDDKGMAAAIVAVTLELARARTPLARDVIVALTAGEETGGGAGARWLVEKHKDLIDAEIALNEGDGLHLSDDLSKVKEVGFGVSEKTYQNYKLVAHGPGGHSSVPPTDVDPASSLALAMTRVGAHRFPGRVLPEVRSAFQSDLASAKPELVEALRHAVASAPVLAPADDEVLRKDRIYNALLRTTCVVTMLKGAPQENVLPTTAEANVNCRILPGDTREQTQAALVAAIADPSIEVTPADAFGDGASSPAEGEVLEAVKKVTAARFGAVPIIASMSTGASDSRFLRGIGIHAYGISSSATSRAEAMSSHGAHGPDERRPLRWIPESTQYFRDLVRLLALP